MDTLFFIFRISPDVTKTKKEIKSLILAGKIKNDKN